MKKQKKFLVGILIFLSIILTSYTVFGFDITNYIQELEFSDEYKKYMELEEDERANVIMPRMYDIPKSTVQTQNPFRLFRMLGTTATDDFSLRTFIPENMVIKDQNPTNSCWTFSSLAALESHLALKHKRNYTTPAIVYDFSERHMEYSMSQSFYDGPNALGFNRQVGSGGSFQTYIPYLTNGTGAIAESAMPFEPNEDTIYISDIQGHEVISQVNDIVEFPSYTPSDDLTLIKQQMKEHIKNYGAIDAAIYGAAINDTRCYNNATGALYCNSSSTFERNHAVAIVGWIDNYPITNFSASSRPTNPGAWIIKNSWGTSQVINGQTVKIGDEGFMYVSYEDANIYLQLTGIEDAQDELNYENIYQYSEFDGYMIASLSNTNKIYLATVFDKKTEGLEYITQVSLRAPEKYTCKVYVNPNGTDKIVNETTKVALKMGESETIEPGYHTIEFLNPVQVTGDNFVVIVEIQGARTNVISMLTEFNSKDFAAINSNYATYDYYPLYDNVKVESGKCFWTIEEGIDKPEEWMDTSIMATVTSGNWPNFDTTIKAFTTSRIFNGIAVTNPPSTTTYIEGDDFDPTGMVVEAVYTNGDSEVITGYTISDGENLVAGQTAVTITYEGKTTTQQIEVKENVVESLTITNPPSTTSYIEGDDFDPTGMVVQATRINGDTEIATDYTILDGEDLRAEQTAITILYEGVTVTQDIEVIENVVETLTITTPAPITSYIEGDDFDPTGMVVQATRINGDTEVVTNYTIPDGEDLRIDQTSVTITFEGKTATQDITVIENVIESIFVSNPPKRTEYIEGDNFDATEMVVEAKRINGDTEVITGYTITGGEDLKVSQTSVTITYKGKITTQSITVVENSIQIIYVTNPPAKTRYYEGENFIADGMVVEAKHLNGKTRIITGYEISDGDALELGQTSVTITYGDKTTTQTIEVLENVVASIKVINPPNKTKYIVGENFVSTGMVVQATRVKGDTEVVTGYTISKGEGLVLGQTSVTITYQGKTTIQSIEVLENVVASISIVNPPKKTSYIEGQDFDPTEMVVQAKRLNGDTEEVTGYKVSNGTDLSVGQTTVTITYKEFSVTQGIAVVAKKATAISIKSLPTKTEYLQNKEKLDLTGGVIEVSYNDGSKKEFVMKFDKIVASGFNNETIGQQVITLTYENLTTQFNIEIKEEPKPENSNFDNIVTKVQKIRAYYFSDDNEKEYVVIDVAIDNFIKSKVNESLEYYYCLSTTENSLARNMFHWIKIENMQQAGENLTFEINSLDVLNYEELVNAENIYLYVKEVATRNGMTKESVMPVAVLDVKNIIVEEYIDGEKKAEISTDEIIDSTVEDDETDNTFASGKIPHAGKSAVVIGVIIAISIFGRATYLRYRKIQIK